MTTHGTVIDGSTGKGVSGVSIYAVDQNGMPVRLPGVTSDDQGNFVFPYNIDYPIRLEFSSIGYDTLDFYPENASGDIIMDATTEDLGAVVITAFKKVAASVTEAVTKSNTGIYIAVAVIAYGGFLFFMLHKRKK